MEHLQKLGLSKYESQAYLSVLKLAPTTAKEVSQVSGVPMGRIYEVLDQLQNKSVITAEEQSRPKRYIAVQPEKAVDRLLNARRRELNTQIAEYEQIAADLPAQISAQLSADPEVWSAAVSAEDADELILSRIASATDSIDLLYGGVALDPNFENTVPKVATKFDDALSRDISIRVLAEHGLMDALFADDTGGSLESLSEYSNWHMRESDNVDMTMYTFDDSEVCLVVPKPLEPSEPLAVINIKGRQLSADCTQSFEALWTEANPVSPPTE